MRNDFIAQATFWSPCYFLNIEFKSNFPNGRNLTFSPNFSILLHNITGPSETAFSVLNPEYFKRVGGELQLRQLGCPISENEYRTWVNESYCLQWKLSSNSNVHVLNWFHRFRSRETVSKQKFRLIIKSIFILFA